MSRYLSSIQSLSETEALIENLPVSFEINKIIPLNEGYDNICLEVNDEWIFRFPKKADVPIKREIELLKMVKGKFHVQIPVVEYVFQDPVGIAYRKIQGGELTLDLLHSMTESQFDNLVDDTAQFFADLHSAVSVHEAHEIGIEESFSINYIDVIRKQLLPWVVENDVREFAQACLLDYEKLSPTENIVVLHTDVSPDNMAFNVVEKKLVGLFDFSDVAVGDMNLEFVHLLKFDLNFTKKIIESYTKKTGRKCDLNRVRLYKQLNTLADFAFQLNNPHTKRYQEYLQLFRKWIHEPNLPL